MLRRILVALTLTFLASTASPAQDATGLETLVKLRGFQQKIKLDTMVIWKEIEASPAAAYSSARHILDSLKLKIHVADSVRGVLHADFHSPAGKIAGHQRSWVVSCGSGHIGGDYADTWRLSMSYVVYVEPGKEDKTRLGAVFVGGADPIEGVSKASMPCPSTGNMELLLFKAVQLRVLSLPGAIDQR